MQQNELVGVKHSSRTGSVKASSAGGRGAAPNQNHKLMAAALANAFAALPCLLRCYDPQQLASVASSSASGSVAVVQSDEGGGLEGSSGGVSTVDSSTTAATTTTIDEGAESGMGISTEAAESSAQEAAGSGAGSWGLSSRPSRPAATGQDGRDGGGERQSGEAASSATRGRGSTSSRTGSSGSARATAEAAALLLPPSVVGPMLGVLARRLDLLRSSHLCALADALVKLQLYPGRAFLMAHVSALPELLILCHRTAVCCTLAALPS